MLTTAFIMLVGVFFDIGVWYYAKPLVIFGPGAVFTTHHFLRNERVQ
jgi:hypothetical protein